ncbi:hypothetical protein [Leptospira perdikensis]|uniref:Uncharacterized protein n=1 Tax=Leptospira perdikensis TaxID=2484948 RepID=A0A4R9J7A4_9LEPT|nr:hypothetical protein [Leptospira perdikensis]TGL33517.1 hypothetical protein EHQ49_17980 [Leptospira perdikensis]
MKLLVGILVLLIQCTSFDRRSFLGIGNSIDNDRRNYQNSLVTETGHFSECLLPPDGQYPFPRLSYCYVGSRPIRSQLSSGKKQNGTVRPFLSIIPGYALEGHSHSELYKDVALGRGPFHNRSLKENILRQSMQQNLPGKIPSVSYSRGGGL